VCIICSELAGSEHWSEQAVAGVADHGRATVRRRMGEVVRRVVGTVGLDGGLAGTGVGYALPNRKGRTELVGGMEEAWMAAERLSGRRLDPLDEELLVDLLGGRS
jgi:hypothetical protein